ncbi:MAG TPA: DUF397 domain-containing protein [Actinophytocola sp.]|uniref:DUF397 domain-containing protein n=1 Tax=Actinophytocola sp. TaxID=1872138 RepID=UPI002DDC9FDA|nr:DUF397 domain-containing protein [Actinophytocola sp.]HEV2780635.1 DUF397 domain-containing protein [Actinophytocola sp.]
MCGLVPIHVVWHKSSHSNGDGNVCVEIAFLPDGMAVRDSKNPAGGALVMPRRAWEQFRKTLRESGPTS